MRTYYTYPRIISVDYLKILLSSLEKKIFKDLHSIWYVQIVFGYCFAKNVGGVTI